MKKFWLFAGLYIVLAGVAWGQTTYTWVGTTNDWSDSDNWTVVGTPITPYPSAAADNIIIDATGNYPTVPDTVLSLGTVTINGGTITLSRDLTVATLTITGTATINGNTFSITTTNFSAVDNTDVLVGTATKVMGGGTLAVTGTAVTLGNVTGTTGTLTAGSKNVTITTDGGNTAVSIGGITTSGTKSLTISGTKELNPGVNNFNSVNISTAASIITLTGALNVNAAGASTLTNNGTLNLGTYNLNVGTLANANTGTIRLAGNQTITVGAYTPTAGRPGGTISYYGAVNWPFGNDYTYLTIENGATMGSTAGDLNVSQNAIIGANISAASVTVTGTSTVSANVTTTGGTQEYRGLVTLGGVVGDTRNLTGTSVTLGQITEGNAVGLTITGNGTLSGGTNIGAITISQNATFQTNPLSAASVDVTGTSAINANITTTGAQAYNGTVTLGGAVGARSLSGSTVTLGRITNGNGHALTITGNAVLNGSDDPSNIGAITISQGATFQVALYAASVTVTNASGTSVSAINADITTTGGTQTYNGTVTLGTGTRNLTGQTITLGNITGGTVSGLTITGNGTLRGCTNAGYVGNLTVTGTATFQNNIFNAASVNVTGTGTSTISANITTTTAGGQSYAGNVTLGAGVTLSANGLNNFITFSGTVNGANSLTITNATVIFNGAVGTAAARLTSVTIYGNSTINADIYTSEAQSYGNAITNTVVLGGTGTRVLNSNGGSITATGVVSSALTNPATGITVTARNGIAFSNSNNSFGGTITLNNNQGNNANRTGNVTFTTLGDVTITGASTANVTDEGNFTISARIINTGAITATGTVSLTTNNQNITVGGAISGNRAVLNAGSGTVSIGSSITVSSNGTEGANNAAVYINADILEGNGSITPGASGQVCVYIGRRSTYDGSTYTGTVRDNPPRIHYHSTIGHIIYRRGPDDLAHGITAPYTYIDSSTVTGSAFEPDTNCNIYIIDVAPGTLTVGINTFTGNGYSGTNGFIEIRGRYSAASVTFEPAANSKVRFVNGETGTSPTVNLSNGAFSLPTGITLELAGGTTTASITASGGISLRTITASAGASHLSLTSANNTISVEGTIGAATNRLGDISVSTSSTATFSGNIFAASFTQTAGTSVLSAQINTTAVISFTGPVRLDGNATLDSSAGNGIISFNSTANTITSNNNSNLTISSGTGEIATRGPIGITTNPLGILIINNAQTGILNLYGNITTNNANITLGGPVVLYANNLQINSGGGSISFNNTINNNDATRRDLTVNAGAGDITFGGIVGTDAANQLNNLTLTNQGTVNLNAIIYAASVIFNGGPNQKVQQNDTGTAARLGNVQINGHPTLGNTILTLTGNVRQRDGSTLTLNASGSLDTGTGNTSWFMGNAASPAGIIGFVGISGTLVLNASAELITRDFYNTEATDHEVSIRGINTIITASRNVTINRTFAPITGRTILDCTIVMTGTGDLSVRQAAVGTPYPGNSTRTVQLPQVDIGHLIIDSSATVPVTVASNLYIRGNLTIKNGTLNGGTAHIFLFPLNQAGNTWKIEPGGTFSYSTSFVEFGNVYEGTSGHIYEIIGNTTWWYLICHEPLAELRFSNHDLQYGLNGHKIYRMLEVFPNSSAEDFEAKFITLTRKDYYNEEVYLTAANPTEPYTPPSAPVEFFWYFDLQTGGNLEINHVSVKYSYSSTGIPVPREGPLPDWDVRAWPYVWIDSGPGGRPINDTPYYYYLPDSRNFYNVDWFVFNNFFYAFAEDSNLNGRIDRIRLQSNFRLNGDFSGFEVVVYNEVTRELYEIDKSKAGTDRGYQIVNSSDPDDRSIYVWLVEKPYADTGARLHWQIEKNASLMDDPLGKTLIGNPRPMVVGAPDMDQGTVTNTAPPRITFALALPGHDEIYVQFSGPVELIGGLSVSGYTVLDHKFVSQNELLIKLSDPLTVSDFAPPPNITINGFRDYAIPAANMRDPVNGGPYYTMFPSPRYPVNYSYSSYVPEDQLNPPPLPPSPTPSRVYPPNLSYTVSSGAPAATITNRITDMLVSVPPGPDRQEDYFAWPVWARYKDDYSWILPPGDDFRDQDYDAAGIIWEFNGTKFLEARNMTMQVKRNPALNSFGSGRLDLVFDYNIPSSFRARAMNAYGFGNGNSSLWVPSTANTPNIENRPPYTNMAPYFYVLNYPYRLQTSITPSLSGDLYIYDFTVGSDGYGSGQNMEFFFLLDNSRPDLFAGRLDIRPSDPIPSDWYRRVKPFGFAVHDVTPQRSGVTILNNVINPDNGERTYVDYRLARGGQVTIQVFTLDGTMVDVLYRGYRDAGEYRAAWAGTNRSGRAVARGLYYIRVVGPDIDELRKVMVVR